MVTTSEDGRLFPEITSYGAEDPMVWISEDSTIHAILHDEQGPNRCTAFGRHAFAVDGGTRSSSWHYGDGDGVFAYNGTVQTTSGTVLNYFRRERPHMVVDSKGWPTHLSNGVQEQTTDDRSYTLIQPLARDAGE